MGEREWNAHPITQKASKFSRLVSWPRIFPTCLVNIHLDTIDRECNRAYLLVSLSLRFETVTDIFSPPPFEHLDRTRGYLEKTGRIFSLPPDKNNKKETISSLSSRFERRRKRGVSVGARWATREMKEGEKVREEGDTRGGQSRLKMQSG